MAVLNDLNQTPHAIQLAKENETLKALLASMQLKLAAQPVRKLTLKVTAKKPDGTGTDGAISLYGLGRFPVTLYAGGWERLIAASDEITAFIAANASIISRKA